MMVQMLDAFAIAVKARDEFFEEDHAGLAEIVDKSSTDEPTLFA